MLVDLLDATVLFCGGHPCQGALNVFSEPRWGAVLWLCARDDSPDSKVLSPCAYLMDILNLCGPCSVNNTSLPPLSFLRSAGRRQCYTPRTFCDDERESLGWSSEPPGGPPCGPCSAVQRCNAVRRHMAIFLFLLSKVLHSIRIWTYWEYSADSRWAALVYLP